MLYNMWINRDVNAIENMCGREDTGRVYELNDKRKEKGKKNRRDT